MATERVPGALSVAAGAWVSIGSRDEPAELSGATHFLEHLVFKGAAGRDARQISQAVDRVGGDINAFTSKEYTGFYCRLPARSQALAIELLGDVVTRPLLRDADVDNERQVILEELAMDDDCPDDVAHRHFTRQLFPDSALGAETAGSIETVEALQPAQIRDFHTRHYRAGSTVVSVCGPGEHDETVAAVEQAFATINQGDGRVARCAPVAATGGEVIEDDTEQVHLVMGLRLFDRNDPDREALDVVNHVFGGGLSCRLFDEIRERRGLAYSVYSGVSLYSDAGALTMYAGTKPEHAGEVLGLMRSQYELLRRDGLSADELDIAKGYLTGAYELGLEDTGSRMSRTAGLLTAFGAVRPVGDQVRRWFNVTLDDTRRVIERALNAELTVVALGPISADDLELI